MRVLMCPPDFFDVHYEINAWMSVTRAPVPAEAKAQWEALHRILRDEVGLDVSLVAPHPGWPDMVFTANAGIVQGKTFVPSRFRYAERAGEVPYFNQWFSDNGFELVSLPEDTPGSFEGEGDALFYGDLLLAGYGQRSDISALDALGPLLGRTVLPLRLVDGRWYHLDTCLIPITPELLAYYPPAFDAAANAAIEALPGDKILISDHDSLVFGGNAVVAGEHVVMNAGCDALADALSHRGFTIHATPLGEFIKSGGSAKCLVLVLDH